MATTDLLFLAGRLVLGGYFLLAASNHFTKADMMAQYAKAKGVRAPKVAVLFTGALLALGGLSLVLGAYPSLGLAALAAFLVGVTPQMHAFWKETDPMARMGEQVNFMKNTALLGAVVALYAVPTPWTFALDLPAVLP